MTPKQVELVQSTWKMVLPISDTAAELFYGKLFDADPALKALFKGDMKAQGRKLMQMIGTAVNGLANLGSIVPAVQDLGRRHVKYGVKDKDYDTVAGALVWTLGQGLGEKFTPEVKDAWVAAYTILAKTMKDAAATAPA
jgi:hemoglobin-like flavoprotein